MYFGPDDTEYGDIDLAAAAIAQHLQGSSGPSADCSARGTAMCALRRLANDFQEGHAVDDCDATEVVGNGQQRAACPKSVALSQLDDWLHRGNDPIVAHMNLYVYTIWVYRVEKSPFLRE